MDGQQHMGIRAPGKPRGSVGHGWATAATALPSSALVSAASSPRLACLLLAFSTVEGERGASPSQLLLAPAEGCGVERGLSALSVDFAHSLASSRIFISL